MLSLFQLGQSQSVFTAGIGPGLKRTKAIGNNRQQDFMGNAIDTNFVDWPVLEKKDQ